MRVVKFLAKDKKETAAADIFMRCVAQFPFRLPENIELRISEMDALVIEEEMAIIAVDRKKIGDEKVARSIFFESLNRIFVRQTFGQLPPLVEDVIVSRETAKILGDDYLYYLHMKIFGKKPKDFGDYLATSVPWVAFFPVDKAAAEILYSAARNKTYEARAKSLFDALKKNLWIDDNLEKALKRYRRFDAGSKVQMGKLAAGSGSQQRLRI